MKIGLVIYGSIDSLSGGTRYDRRLVDYLRAQGDEVEIISLTDHGYFLNLYTGWFLGPLIKLWGRRFDVLLVDELTHAMMGWMIEPIRKQLGCKVISIVHHLASDEPRARWKNWLIRRAERMLLMTVDGHICNTETTADRVRAMDHRPAPISVALPGVIIEQELPAIEEIRARGERSGPPHLLLVGNIIERKGVLELLTAFDETEIPEWTLSLVGRTDLEPAYAERVRQKIEQSGVGDRVTLHGPLEGDQLAEEYRRADFFAMPSSYEGFGIAYLEAMAYGLPVIASRAGGAVEIVKEGVNGFLVTPGDQAGLAEKLITLAGDATLRVKLGLEARATFDRHPTWEESFAGARAFLEARAGG
ncbi:glycosyltransferase family 4 protein [bacterium]|nr:glycosyltransferase family 4 protein [bacterium]